MAVSLGAVARTCRRVAQVYCGLTPFGITGAMPISRSAAAAAIEEGKGSLMALLPTRAILRSAVQGKSL